MDFVVTWFKGEERLWKPYWLGGVVGGICWQILSYLADFAGMFVSIFVLVLTVFYQCWLLPAIWRCAFNVNSNVWGYLARVSVVFAVLGWIAIVALAIAGLTAIAIST